MGQRRHARELALQVLFQLEFAPSIDFRQSLETFRGNFSAPADVWNYASELLEGIVKNKETIDQLIQSHSAHWTLKRMALVDLNIMRVATWELRFSEASVPPAVAINEAIEISKKYGTSDSAAFVNGILDQIVKL